jgi:hypothetical protein
MFLVVGLVFHFWRILILVRQHNWFNLQAELDELRLEYGRKHGKIMGVAFGRGYDAEMNFRRL